MKKITIIAVVVVIIAVAGYFLFSSKDSGASQTPKLDASDTVSTFYADWLKAAKDPNAKPSKTDLAKSPSLSKTLSDKLVTALKNPNTTPDPVLCQSVVPADISTRKVFENVDTAQSLITSKDKKVTEQAVVDLSKDGDMWHIDSIECSLGEFAPVKEFSFEKEGYLIKASVPKPYDPKNWHLVFEENGEQGHIVPLFFDATSQCTSLSGAKAACKPDQFTEATKVSVHAQMTEQGASVKQLEFIK